MILLSVERLADKPERSCLGLPAMEEPTCRITHKYLTFARLVVSIWASIWPSFFSGYADAFQLTEGENGVASHFS